MILAEVQTVISTKRLYSGIRGALGGLCILVAPGLAGADSPKVMVTVKVTVVAPPPCVINDDRPIEVDFGDVLTTRVDGNNYRLPIDYTLTCTDASSNAMKLQIRGNGAAFNPAVLQTDQPALGIALQKDGSMLAVNDWLKFTYPDKPQLYAVPVKQAGAILKVGGFSAAATFTVDYQ